MKALALLQMIEDNNVLIINYKSYLTTVAGYRSIVTLNLYILSMQGQNWTCTVLLINH